jgi:hypothetical protein
MLRSKFFAPGLQSIPFCPWVIVERVRDKSIDLTEQSWLRVLKEILFASPCSCSNHVVGSQVAQENVPEESMAFLANILLIDVAVEKTSNETGYIDFVPLAIEAGLDALSGAWIHEYAPPHYANEHDEAIS